MRSLLSLSRRNLLCRALFVGGWLVLYVATFVEVFAAWPTKKSWDIHEIRPKVEAQLQREPGGHLIVCRYSKDHAPYQEYVYNRADIDAAKIVWARELSPQENQRLFNYFRDRTIWLFQPDQGRTLEKYDIDLHEADSP
jgi:hypothetical protein